MAMDVYGRKPTSAEGKYFRRNVWGWRPLATYLTTTFPNITQHCKYWQSNDGGGLGMLLSLSLARGIDKDIEDGHAAQYIAERDAHLANLKPVPCQHCNGVGRMTGTKNAVFERVHEDGDTKPRLTVVQKKCSMCDGTGEHLPFDTWYSLTLEDLVEFSAFLKVCGGFKIC